MTRRYTRIGRPLTASLAAVLVCVACAERSAPPPRSAPSTTTPVAPAEEGEKKSHEEAPPVTPDATSTTTTAPGIPQQPTPSPAPAPTSAPSDTTERRARALRAARTEVDQAQRDLEASMSDCAAACRALGSMERATGHLCDLASDHDDRRRCEDAKTAVLRAREKIRAACGSCPNGPSLDKTAPIPSRP